MDTALRPLGPGDYEHVIARLDAWWGREVAPMLPRLFFDHFADTSIAAGPPGAPVGFLCGFVSRTDPTLAYIHFVGVDPSARTARIGRRMYEWFFERASRAGCTEVRCVTSPANTGSRAFHRALGFDEHEAADYDGRGESRMVMRRPLAAVTAGAHLELVTIIVEEYDPAIAFFVDVLGFELVDDSPSETNDGRPKRWVVVRPDGAATGILLARAEPGDQTAAIGRQLAGRVGFFLRVTDFDATLARLVAAGTEIVTPPRTMPYGRVAVFADICGNRWDLLGR